MDVGKDSSDRSSVIEPRLLIDSFLELVDECIVVVGKDGSIRLVNKQAEKLLGQPQSELAGKHLVDIFTLEDDKGNKVTQENHPVYLSLASRSSTPHSILVLAKKDGSKFPVSIVCAPIVAQGDGQVSGVAVVLKYASIEVDLRRTKMGFVPFAAHQLRTPLGSIRWNTEILLSGKLGEVPVRILETVQNIYDSTQQMIRLVNDLLSLSRIEEGKIPNDPDFIDVDAEINLVAREVSILAEKRAVKLDIAVPDNLPKLFIDPARFRDVMQNILSNAVKFNKVGGSVKVNAQAIDGSVLLEVQDTGIGIPREDMDQLFGKFFRAKNAVAGQTEGTGLGLYVIKYYMDAWGGKVTINSVENKGTTVKLLIPVDQTHTRR